MFQIIDIPSTCTFCIALGSIFGGIHCAGWNFIFAEQKLWRVVSLVFTTIPIAVLPFTLIVALVIIVKYSSDLDGFLANLTLFFSMLAYASPRLVQLYSLDWPWHS